MASLQHQQHLSYSSSSSQLHNIRGALPRATLANHQQNLPTTSQQHVAGSLCPQSSRRTQPAQHVLLQQQQQQQCSRRQHHNVGRSIVCRQHNAAAAGGGGSSGGSGGGEPPGVHGEVMGEQRAMPHVQLFCLLLPRCCSCCLRYTACHQPASPSSVSCPHLSQHLYTHSHSNCGNAGGCHQCRPRAPSVPQPPEAPPLAVQDRRLPHTGGTGGRAHQQR